MSKLNDNLRVGRKFDRRVKLTPEQRQNIVHEYSVGDIGTQRLARKYGVSKRTIQFIIHPEKRIENYKMRVARGGSKQYYDREENRVGKREHRAYKRSLHSQGLI